MGNCFVKSKGIEELEDEVGMLLQQKLILENKVKELDSDTSRSSIGEVNKYIDKDEYNTMRTIESLNYLVAFDPDFQKNIIERFASISNLHSEVRVSEYIEIKSEVSEAIKKSMKFVEENTRTLQEFCNSKRETIKERLELFENYTSLGQHFIKEKQAIKDKFKGILKAPKCDFGILVRKIMELNEIDFELGKLEKAIPRLYPENILVGKIKEIESSVSSLIKSSLNSLKSLECILGSSEIPENIDIISLKSAEINKETYITLGDSLIILLKNLQELEHLKESIITKNNVFAGLKSIDEKISFYFLSSQRNKDETCSRLRRLSRASIDLTSFKQELLQQDLIFNQTLAVIISELNKKIDTFLSIAESQDKVVMDNCQKLNLIEENIDELELKLQEFISEELNNLFKIIPVSDTILKEKADTIKEKINENKLDLAKDLMERLENLIKSIDCLSSFTNLNELIRESISKELNRIKATNSDKINELNSKINFLENEKHGLERDIENTKKQLDAASELAEKMIQSCSNKDLETIKIKNHLATQAEKLKQIESEKYQNEDEIDELRKDLRETKKNLRLKENELSEIKQSIEANNN